MTANPRSDWELFSAIRKEELSEAIASNRVQVVNVLEAPKAGRLRLIAHSRHIPLSELEERLGELDRGRDVVVYCKNRECPASLKAARLLAEQGFHVRAYEGGIEEWVAAGLPTDADARKLPRTETATVDLAPSSREPSVGATSAEPEQASGARAEEAKDETPGDVEAQQGVADSKDEAADQQPVPPTERAPRAEAADRKPADAASSDAAAEPDPADGEPTDVQGEAKDRGGRAAAEKPFREPASSFLDCLSASPPSSRGS